jgi:hypothetical protein
VTVRRPPANGLGKADLIELHVVLKRPIPAAEAEAWGKGLADRLAQIVDKRKVEAVYLADVRGDE